MNKKAHPCEESALSGSSVLPLAGNQISVLAEDQNIHCPMRVCSAYAVNGNLQLGSWDIIDSRQLSVRREQNMIEESQLKPGLRAGETAIGVSQKKLIPGAGSFRQYWPAVFRIRGEVYAEAVKLNGQLRQKSL